MADKIGPRGWDKGAAQREGWSYPEPTRARQDRDAADVITPRLPCPGMPSVQWAAWLSEPAPATPRHPIRPGLSVVVESSLLAHHAVPADWQHPHWAAGRPSGPGPGEGFVWESHKVGRRALCPVGQSWKEFYRREDVTVQGHIA